MKYAIVTGGARGLGLGIVRALLTDEVVDRIAVIDRALVPAPADVGDRVEGFDGDVTDATQIHAAVEKITAKFGPHPDVLCNNAGGGESGWFESGRDTEWHSVEIWRRYVELNLNSVYIVSKEIVPRMVAGGAVCNTSLEIGKRNVNANCVAPGATETPLLQSISREAIEAIRASIPKGRLASVDDIVPAYIFLASDESHHFVGQCISPNGGDVML